MTQEHPKNCKCQSCGSEHVDIVTRVTGYFSKNSMWNKGKIAELRDRDRKTNMQFFNSGKI